MPAPREESAETLKVTRAIFNFESKCNMACRFCYVPFQRATSTLDDWQAIVSRIIELGARSIVFGGGDPLAFPDFRTLLPWMRETQPAGIRIHVDTNGIGFTDSDKTVLALANSVGLPFDGSTPAVHDAGEAYTLDRNDVTRYAPLGSIFDAHLLTRWRLIAPRSPGRGIPLGERTKPPDGAHAVPAYLRAPQ